MILIVTYKSMKDEAVQIVGLKIEYNILKLKVHVNRIRVTLKDDELHTIDLKAEIQKIDRL